MKKLIHFVVLLTTAMAAYVAVIPSAVKDLCAKLNAGEIEKAEGLRWVPNCVYAVGLVAVAPVKALFSVPDAPQEEQAELLLLSWGAILVNCILLTSIFALMG